MRWGGTIAFATATMTLVCGAAAQARTEYCPANLWYRPAIPAADDGRSSGLVYGFFAGAPRTLVSVKIVADTDGGWFTWDDSGVRLTERTNHEAESTRRVATFGKPVFVRHAWVVEARTSGDSLYGWDAIGDAACGIPSFGKAAYYSARTAQVAQGFPTQAATPIAAPYTTDCQHPFQEATVKHAIQPVFPQGVPGGIIYESEIEVQIGDADNVLNAWVYKSSGNRNIDRSALAAAAASTYASAVAYCQKANGDYLFRALFTPNAS